MTSVWALIVAAGSGQRFNSHLSGVAPKQHQVLLDKTVLETSVHALLNTPGVCAVMVILAPNDSYRLPDHPHIYYSQGGSDRYQSVLNGLKALQFFAKPDDLVLVHDAARPCVKPQDIQNLIAAWAEIPQPHRIAVCLGAPSVDNMQQIDEDNLVVATPDRSRLWRAFTPQAASLTDLIKALELAPGCRDEAEAIVRQGGRVKMVLGSTDNIKITHPEDLLMAQFILQKRSYQLSAKQHVFDQPSFKIGHGYDVHAFQPGDFLILGGVRIPHDRAILAHSDGDVLLHAICDAVLGALGRGDIGIHFPDTSASFANIDSRKLLAQVVSWMYKAGWQLANLDATLIAQAPKLRPYIMQMQHYIAADFAVSVEQINIKATTTERLGFIGRQEGLAAEAIVLLTRLPVQKIDA